MGIDDNTDNIDRSKLTPDQVAQLEQYNFSKQQTQALGDLADMVQEISFQLDSHSQTGSKITQAFSALLMDMRESLASLNSKETPSLPDYAKPVVEAVSKLEQALSASIKAIDLKPVVNIPKLDTPQVSVAAPEVDLSGVEKAVTGLAKSFQEAIKLIKIPEQPETDFGPLLTAWEGISEQLVSIENATRLKPQPGSMRISNLSEVTSQIQSGTTPLATRTDSATTASVTYVGKAPIGTQTASPAWQLFKMDETTANTLIITWADGDSNYNNKWDDRATKAYS